jgi:predicted amidophosphoribosyltransferase
MNINCPECGEHQPKKNRWCRKCEAELSPASPCSLRELIEDELRDLWQWGYDREPREESVQPRLDAIMRIIEVSNDQEK